MRGHDLGQVLFVLLFAHRNRAGRRGGCIGKARRGRRTLDTGVHIRLVVIAEVHHIVPALHRTGERLEADVVGAAVAADGEELVGVIQLALAFEHIVSRLDAAAGRGRVLEGRVDIGILPRGVGIQEGRNLQTRGRVAHDCLVALVERAQHAAAHQARAAARAQAVSADKALGLGEFFLVIVSH